MDETRNTEFSPDVELNSIKDALWRLTTRVYLLEDYISEKFGEVIGPNGFNKSNSSSTSRSLRSASSTEINQRSFRAKRSSSRCRTEESKRRRDSSETSNPDEDSQAVVLKNEISPAFYDYADSREANMFPFFEEDNHHQEEQNESEDRVDKSKQIVNEGDPPPVKKRQSLSLKEKMEVINLMKSGKKKQEVCQEIGLPEQTIRRIWCYRKKIEQQFETFNPNVKKARKCEFPEVEAAVLEWVKLQTTQTGWITGPMILDKAKQVAESQNMTEFRASSGWLDSFKKRHAITSVRMKNDDHPPAIVTGQSTIGTLSAHQNNFQL